MEARPLRLSLQLGVASLSNFALGFGLVVPAVAVFPLGVYYFGTLEVFWLALGLVLMSLYAIRRGWRLRPSDLAFEHEGLRVHGGPKHGYAMPWHEVLDVSVADFKDKEDFKDRSYRLLIHLRGASDELAQTDDEQEAQSLSAIRDAIKGRLTTAPAPRDAPQGRAGTTQGRIDATLPRCSSCGSPVAPEAYDDLRCRTCGAALTMPEDIHARVQAARALPVDLARATRGVNTLVDQPGATATTLLVLVALVPMALAWPIAGIVIVRAYLAGHLDNALAAGVVALPFLLIIDGFFLARGRMVDRRAVFALAFSHAASPPAREGESPSCRACGAPLPIIAKTESIARCVYCGADNVTAIDLRLPANAARSAARSLDEALAERGRARARWRWLTLASLPFVACSVWLLAILYRAGS